MYHTQTEVQRATPRRASRDDDRSFPPESRGDLLAYAKKLGTSPRQLAFAEGLFDRGLAKKAKRAAACGRLGGRVRCIDFHFYRQPFFCGLRGCPRCGRVAMGQLRKKYVSVVRSQACLIEDECRKRATPCRHLKMQFTATTGGPPSPEALKTFNENVKECFAAAQQRSGLPPTTNGALWSTTIEGNSIVAHARYVGPQLSDDVAREWIQLGGPNAVVDIRRMDVGPDSHDPLNDVLVTPLDLSAAERANLEAAGDRTRLTHSMGAFYANPAPPTDEAEAETCPACGQRLYPTGDWTYLAQLEAEGIRDLAEVRRELKASGQQRAGPPGHAAPDGADRGCQASKPSDSEPWNR